MSRFVPLLLVVLSLALIVGATLELADVLAFDWSATAVAAR